eukprot:g3575.t1
MKYAVRGEVLDVAMDLRERLKDPANDLPFDELISCNIGNPQALGQKPPPFNRQVMSLVTNPALLETAPDAFLPQARLRAQKYISEIKGGIGAYSNSQGVEVVRQEVAEFIAQRDGYPSSPENIFLTNGASDGVKALMQTVIRGGKQRDGVLVPIPQYPLYSAVTTLFDGELVGYYLDEENGWSMSVAELRRAVDEATAKGVTVRGLVVINPGNPTSQQLQLEAMKDVVRFCIEKGLVLMADEVYQENLYGSAKGTFNSFKKVVMSMGEETQDFELVSFHSISKGYIGECGIRGGYFELHNIDPAVKQQLYKLASISLCSNVMGQVAVGLMVNPPREGKALEMHKTHRETMLASLERRATKLSSSLNQMDGITCPPLKASLYSFPRVHLPPAAVAAAEKLGKEPDMFYCLELLKNTGIITVPGSGFKQREGQYHFRITILPPEEKMDDVLKRLTNFHSNFMKKYRGGEGEL